MKDTYEEQNAIAGFDLNDDSDRLDKGLTGLMAHFAQLFCIFFFFAMWPVLLWWTQF